MQKPFFALYPPADESSHQLPSSREQQKNEHSAELCLCSRTNLTSGAVCSSTCSALFKKQVLPTLLSPAPICSCLGQLTAGEMVGKRREGEEAAGDLRGVALRTEGFVVDEVGEGGGPREGVAAWEGAR